MDEADSVSEVRRRNMQAVRSTNTKPEMTIRRLLHGMGYRYRLHVKDLPGRPDLVFPARRAIIEVRGCFWHRHADSSCKNAVLPATRREWWQAKLERNVARDRANEEALSRLGWRVAVVWECEVRRDARMTAAGLAEFLGSVMQKSGARNRAPRSSR